MSVHSSDPRESYASATSRLTQADKINIAVAVANAVAVAVSHANAGTFPDARAVADNVLFYLDRP